jgi:hypothetical protein
MADVNMLGNVLYQILAESRPWQQKEDRIANPLYPNQTIDGDTMRATKLRGVIPHLPDRFYVEPLATDLASQALWYAIQACFIFQPEQRPTSFQLAVSLTRAYQKIQQKDLQLEEIPKLFPQVRGKM